MLLARGSFRLEQTVSAVFVRWISCSHNARIKTVASWHQHFASKTSTCLSGCPLRRRLKTTFGGSFWMSWTGLLARVS